MADTRPTPQTPAAAPAPGPEAGEPVGHDFLDALLAALAGMAVRSPRRQADLAVALRRSGLDAQEETLAPALRQLESEGCIEHLVPLADGGLLMSVTARGIERLSHTARRHVLDFAGK